VEPGTEVPSPAKRFNDIFVRVKDLAESIHSDQTGAFPYTSQRGNRYVMVAIHLDANYIFNEPMKNRTKGEMIKAYQKIINRMKAAGLGLKTHRLDNEASTAYKECIRNTQGYNTRSRTMNIFQEAMLACVDISKPTYVVSQDFGMLNYTETRKPVFEIAAKQLSSRRIPMTWLCKMANSVLGEKGELLEYRHLISNPKTKAVWAHSYGNEIGRLAQGMPGRNKGTNTIFFIRQDQVPRNRIKDTTYGLITCLVCAEKLDEPNRTRLVAGGDRVHYPGDAGMPTADLLTVKLLINIIISTPGAKFMTMDIKDFYLNTPMTRYEYMRLKMSDMPDGVIEHYNLREIATPDGFIYCEIQKGMYGLPQAGIIAQELLADRLQNHGYTQSKTTPGLWSQKSRPIQFSLVVDDFGVKYVGKVLDLRNPKAYYWREDQGIPTISGLSLSKY
jgi:hypothetical protein